jgi:soluble lytic murein transglycosylase
MLLLRDIVRPSPAAVAERAEHWHDHVDRAAERFEIDPCLVIAIIAVESKGDPVARSSKGASGLMQLMPATAREQAELLGIDGFDRRDLVDPETNILLGTAYLRRQIAAFDGDLTLALAAYNAGPGNVRRWLDLGAGLDPGEVISKFAFRQTKSYVENVLRYRDLIAERIGTRPENDRMDR